MSQPTLPWSTWMRSTGSSSRPGPRSRVHDWNRRVPEAGSAREGVVALEADTVREAPWRARVVDEPRHAEVGLAAAAVAAGPVWTTIGIAVAGSLAGVERRTGCRVARPLIH